MKEHEVGETTWLHRVIKLLKPIKGGCRIRCSHAVEGSGMTAPKFCGDTADHFHTYWTNYGGDEPADFRGIAVCRLHAERIATAEHVTITTEEPPPAEPGNPWGLP